LKILVTGAAGFIGSNFIIDWIEQSKEKIINVDKLTYAGNKENLFSVENSSQYFFEHGDICNFKFLKNIIFKHTPRIIVNFAAESHVDRSINSPEDFIQTNYNYFSSIYKSRFKCAEFRKNQRKSNL
jgi:dTDP-glucose 4,6-dehydratase